MANRPAQWLCCLGVMACAPTSPRRAIATVDLTAPSGTVSDRFLSISVDISLVAGGHFWCASGQVETGAGTCVVPPYDFSRAKLRRMASELAPGFLRIGGSEADTTYYDLSATPVSEPPPPFTEVLTRLQWDNLNEFATALGFRVAFSLAMGPGTWDAERNWIPSTARPLLEYAAGRSDPVELWELGNEINGFLAVHGPASQIDGVRYAANFALARGLIDEVTPGARLGGPSSAFWPVVGEMSPILPSFLEADGPQADVVTWHYYPQQSRRCPLRFRSASLDTLLDPDTLDEVNIWSDSVEKSRVDHAPQAQAWLGETDGAQCGGEPGVSDRFVDSLWWLDELGTMAHRGTPVVIRQSLTGSNYGLLDESTLSLNPDYWSSLLWRRLMGRGC